MSFGAPRTPDALSREFRKSGWHMEDHANVALFVNTGEALSASSEICDPAVFRIQHVSSCKAALAAIASQSAFSVVVLDVDAHPQASLIEIKALAKSADKTPLVVLLAEHDLSFIKAAIRFGALSIIPLNLGLPAIKSALSLVAQGQTFIPWHIQKQLGKSDKCMIDAIESDDLLILYYLYIGKTRAEISNILGITKSQSSLKIQNIYKKLGVRKKSDALSRALNHRLIPNLHEGFCENIIMTGFPLAAE